MTTRRDERGFALLVLLAVVGIGSVGIVVAMQRLVPSSSATAVDTERRFDTVARAARFAFRRSGAFPANLNSLAAAAGLDATDSWRTDPWLPPNDLNYRSAAAGLTLRGRGADRRLNTADDPRFVVATEDQMRARQRGRERMIRAVLLRSPYCFVATMSSSDRAAMRTAMRDHAIARRAWLTADAAARVALQATLTATAATVASLRSAYSRPNLPTRIVGAGGLMQQLGMPDSRANDGIGRRFVRHTPLGIVSQGADRTGGTDDDM